MELPSIKDRKDLRGKRVLVRVDFNVPTEAGKVTDDYRIRQTLPTIYHLQKEGAIVLLISHIESSESLLPVHAYLEQELPVTFIGDISNEATASLLSYAKPGDIFLFENLRKDPGEKANDLAFAERLAALADIYVNDAFSVSHREHASIIGIPTFLPSFMGLLFEEEVSHLSAALNPEHPFLFVLGGAKFSTKLPLVTKFLEIADNVFIGGALANDLFKAQGFSVGDSTISSDPFDEDKILSNKKLLLPTDVVVEKEGKKSLKRPSEVREGEKIFDAGTETLKELEGEIARAQFILWNGPLGYFEKGYTEGTQKLAKLVAASSAHTIVGGGDTLAAIEGLKLMDKFTFVSTGGGAMLDFLAHETLPGIEALIRANK
ncbi:MAG: phosphoglycerate kinase [bacterium]|nr:phosphoglycerate kinase [bacterium]